MAFDPHEYIKNELGSSISPNTPPTPPSTMDALGLGALNGVTIGGAPTIAGTAASVPGAAKSLAQLFHMFNPQENDEDIAKYVGAKKALSDKMDAAQAEHPIAFGAGTIAGGIPLMAYAPVGAMGEAADVGQAMLQAAKVGAGYGAAGGLLSSKANTLTGKAMDAGVGGLAGASVGGIGTLAGKALGAGAKAVFPKVTNASNMGARGINLLTEKSSMNAMNDAQSQGADKALNVIKNVRQSLYNQKNAAKSGAADQLFDLSQPIAEGESLIANINPKNKSAASEASRIQDVINEFTNPTVNSETGEVSKTTQFKGDDALELKKIMSRLSKVGAQPLTDPDAQSIATKLAGKVGTAIHEQNTPLSTSDANYTNFTKNFLEPLGMEDAGTLNQSDYQAKSKLMSKILKNDQPNDGGQMQEFHVNNAQDALAKINPTAAEEFGNTFNQASKDAQTAQASGNTFHLNARHPWASIKGASTRAGNLQGLAVSTVSKMSAGAVNTLGSTISKLPIPGADKLGTIVSSAAQRDAVGRNALMFSLMQNPTYRQILNHQLGVDTSDSSQ